jgi:hypothetical protein
MIVDVEAGWDGDEANGEGGGVLLCVRLRAAVRVACYLAAGCWQLASSESQLRANLLSYLLHAPSTARVGRASSEARGRERAAS